MKVKGIQEEEDDDDDDEEYLMWWKDKGDLPRHDLSRCAAQYSVTECAENLN